MGKKKAAKKASVNDESSSQDASETPVSFETAFAESQKIVRDLEAGNLSLEDSLEAYEVGVRRIRQCQKILNDFERRVELVTGVDRDGNPISQPFDDEEMTLEEKQASRGKRRSATKKKSDLGEGELF